jgi:hypothetical protein
LKYQLIRRNGDFPPGQYIFTDPRTGQNFLGVGFDETVREIIQHRQSNPKVYPKEDGAWLDFEHTAIELEEATCLRIGNNGRFCRPANDQKTFTPQNLGAAVQMPSPCIKCGELMGTEKLCDTCSGRRVLAWICVKCGYLKSK